MKPKETSDTELFATAYGEMKPMLTAIFRQAQIPLADSEDLVQDTFLKVMTIDVLRTETLRSIIVAVAYSLRTDYLRHRAIVRRQCSRLAQSAADYDYADRYLAVRDIERVELSVVKTMSEQNRRIYRLSRYEEQSCEEIALVTHMSYRSVESRLYRARQLVRREVAKAI